MKFAQISNSFSKSSLNGIDAADDETVVKFCSCIVVEELRSFLVCEYKTML